MNANHEGIIPEGTVARGKTTGAAGTLAHRAIHSSRRTLLSLGLLAVLNLTPASRGTAQTLTTLHSFTATTYTGPPNYSNTNSDGAAPASGLITDSSGNTLYGTASQGGDRGNGTVFAVNTNGTGFTILHSFTATLAYPYIINSDGAGPVGLILSGNTLYGTASQGGESGNGTVFALNTNGTGFRILHSFTATSYPTYINADGAGPVGGLILSGNTLYGTAQGGGSWGGAGTVFAINTDGTGFRTLHSFNHYSDGAFPQAGLILSGNTLYGTAHNGGILDYGTVFGVNTNGTGFTILHSFTATFYNINSDGAYPYAGLIISGKTLYGTAHGGGSGGNGTVFAVNTDGTGFTTLHNFHYYDDGGYPYGRLIVSGNTLYGTAGGGNGPVFAMNTDGTNFRILHFFYPYEGAYPAAGLILSGHALYGTAVGGGSSGNGTVFSLALPPPVAQCKNITMSADANCMADASIDNGSFDPVGGNPLTLVQTPPGPYPLGQTSVTLTVFNNHGASNSCSAAVTVVDRTAPVITCPGNIVTDAVSPAGAEVSFAPTASDNCSLTSVTSSRDSGSNFAIGDTKVFCTATDVAGNRAACTFTVHVKSAAEQINDLIALVQSLGLPAGKANSLIAKLQGAATALDRGNIEAACGHLGSFLNEANARKGGKLAVAQAVLLNAGATRIGEVLDCN